MVDLEPDHQEDDSEARSVFVSQLAAKLTARDLAYFLEDKLGDGAVRDCRIVTDRISRRSKGYVLLPIVFFSAQFSVSPGLHTSSLSLSISSRERLHSAEQSSWVFQS